MKPLCRLMLSLSLLVFAALQVHADDAPGGKPVLTLSGSISQTNSENGYVFDMAMLEQLPQYSFVTSTPWFPQPHKFSGPLMRDILTKVGATGETLTAIALNDYKVSIPMDNSTRFNLIVATHKDDKFMTVREKGPLFVLYPFDSDSETQSQVYYDRSIWQLKAIHID
ncbi:hypothetical protein [Marinobacterium rhizophilum]|uniref:Oxidoreductase molybdopterin-binding domain-containing protein n=1 Tax=Marinobacterium rhizophilum TaxID=420402 RepID=A0ABY5HDY3_9GAMM|nr:hypothetical protein [Marinobacterium rhizophilum]UTW10558.1 hypothetical protein KDW95_14810 [Marinobacterium rhizophilum]